MESRADSRSVSFLSMVKIIRCSRMALAIRSLSEIEDSYDTSYPSMRNHLASLPSIASAINFKGSEDMLYEQHYFVFLTSISSKILINAHYNYRDFLFLIILNICIVN